MATFTSDNADFRQWVSPDINRALHNFRKINSSRHNDPKCVHLTIKAAKYTDQNLAELKGETAHPQLKL